MKHRKNIRYIVSTKRVEAVCYVCAAVGEHKYFDIDVGKHVCPGCINSVAQAERAMNASAVQGKELDVNPA